MAAALKAGLHTQRLSLSVALAHMHYGSVHSMIEHAPASPAESVLFWGRGSSLFKGEEHRRSR